MTPHEQLDASPAAQARDRMATQAADRLMNMAHRALDVHGLDPMSFVIVCIAVDTRWRSLVDELMPDNEARWQAERDHGALPVALGIVLREGLQDHVFERQPELEEFLAVSPAAGHAHLLVLDDGGGSVYDIPARSHVLD